VEPDTEHQKGLQATLHHILELLEKQRLVEDLVSRQPMAHHDLVQSLVARQHRSELRNRLAKLHPADIAFVLESLPPEERRQAWELVPGELDGAVLLEVSDAVRETLIADMDRGEILEVAEHLDSDEIADLVPDLPKDVVPELLGSLASEERAEVQSVLAFPEGTVGALMDLDVVSVREDKSLDVVHRYLRLRGELPPHCNQLVVVDRGGVLKGVLSLERLLTSDPDATVGSVMDHEPVRFHTYDEAREAALAFERYGLVSAPVVNTHQQVVGRVTVDAALDYLRADAEKERLSQAGLREEEDLFAPIRKSARNRWAWLGLNLLTAFAASRVIGLFEETIVQLVALAALMPIVASIGGNTGNQTVALTIRGLALDQLHEGNVRYLVRKELGVALVNGVLWGSVMGLITYLIYRNPDLALIMLTAMMLNLVLASMAGVFIPFGLKAVGRDPVLGSSVMLTALTDAMGFFIFLGLAAVFLL
jgi:magnesium transporter